MSLAQWSRRSPLWGRRYATESAGGFGTGAVVGSSAAGRAAGPSRSSIERASGAPDPVVSHPEGRRGVAGGPGEVGGSGAVVGVGGGLSADRVIAVPSGRVKVSMASASPVMTQPEAVDHRVVAFTHEAHVVEARLAAAVVVLDVMGVQVLRPAADPAPPVTDLQRFELQRRREPGVLGGRDRFAVAQPDHGDPALAQELGRQVAGDGRAAGEVGLIVDRDAPSSAPRRRPARS